MRDYTLKDFEFYNKQRYLDPVAKIDKPHEGIEGTRPIEVYIENDIFRNDEVRFYLFNNGIFVGNPVYFNCKIIKEDVPLIANDMIEEFLSRCDFYDLDRELEGKCGCKEYEEVYKSCEECHLFIYGEGKNKEEGCMGYTYSTPDHINFWDCQNKWNEKYGEGTPLYQEFHKERMIGFMNNFMWECGNNKKLIKEVLDYGRTHCNNKFPELFSRSDKNE